MTKQKSFKRRIRARMDKTSESYSAARRQLIAKAEANPQAPETSEPETETAAPGSRPAAPGAVEANRPSSEAVSVKTGRDWEEWFSLLDRWDATARKHSEIAGWLAGEHGVSSWWAQSITVAYEQARGLRAPGQGLDGMYTVSASRTVNVPVNRLFEAVADPQTRERWLTGGGLEITAASASKSVRGKWEGGPSRLVIGFLPKGDSKSQIALSHERIDDPESAGRLKQHWVERLRDLKQLLES